MVTWSGSDAVRVTFSHTAKEIKGKGAHDCIIKGSNSVKQQTRTEVGRKHQGGNKMEEGEDAHKEAQENGWFEYSLLSQEMLHLCNG